MVKADILRSLPPIPGPALTVYLDIDRAESSNRSLVPGYMIWLKSQAGVLAAELSPHEAKLFLEQFAKIEKYLRTHPPGHRGLVLFAGQNTWELVPLPMKVRNQLFWGLPSFSQLLWLLDKHRPRGIVVVTRKGTRFYLFRLGELIKLDERKFAAKTLQWGRKDLGKFARPGIHKSRGSQRDVFEHRMAAQYKRFHRETAECIGSWVERESLGAVFLVGLEEAATEIFENLSRTLKERVILIKEDLGWASPAELQRRLRPRVELWEREREIALVDELLGADRGVVLGIDETLVRLQQGTARSLVVESGLEASLNRCAVCGWVDRVAGPSCSACGGARQTTNLRDALPDLARRYKTSLEVVAGEAARRLHLAGGIGAWLRQ